jgi:hypothetical protein
LQGIVRSLDGVIRFTNEHGRGKQPFGYYLPCTDITARETPDFGSTVEAFALDTAILVVEDEYPLRHAVTKMFPRTGFEVIEAADGFSAIEILHARQNK